MEEIEGLSKDPSMSSIRVLRLPCSGDSCDQAFASLENAGFALIAREIADFEDFAGMLGSRECDLILAGYQGVESFTGEAVSFWKSIDSDIPFFIICDKIEEQKAVELLIKGASIYSRRSMKEFPPVVGKELKVSRGLIRLKEFERRALHAPKLEALGRLAGGVAHDFNNVLATILICGDQIMGEASEGSSISEAMKLILKVADKGTKLTKQLLAFTRNQISEPEIVDLNSLIRSMGKLLRPLVGEDIEFVLQLPSDLSNVKIDPVHLEQILINLIVNARDAMPGGGRLVLETANVELSRKSGEVFDVRPGKYVMFSVMDTGHGMDAKTKAKIFEPFFSTKGENGTGLGLSTVFGIVKQNQGYVMVDSAPGEGSNFKIFLPESVLPLGRLQAEVEEAESETEPERETVLLVEDDRDLREVLTGSLISSGYEVFAVESPEDAIDYAQDQNLKLDIMLTDVVMPRIRGTELAKRVLEHRPDVRILFMSGYTDFNPQEYETFQAVTAFIQKPFTTKNLRKRIAQLRPNPELRKKLV